MIREVALEMTDELRKHKIKILQIKVIVEKAKTLSVILVTNIAGLTCLAPRGEIIISLPCPIPTP